MLTNGLVTVIIPTYNRADTVGRAIESALNQNYPPLEVIVVDDGSTDHTRMILGNYPEVNVFYIPHSGQAEARNIGLQNAKGKYIASLDSDDEWEPEFLSKAVTKLESDELDFVFINWQQEDKKGAYKDFLSHDPFLKPYIKQHKNSWHTINSLELRNLYLHACPSPSSAAVIRKSSIPKGWNNQTRIGDDWYLYLDIILNKNCRVAFTLEVLWKKNINEQNVYNGRKWHEVLEHLFIHDMALYITMFKEKLNGSELNILNGKHIKGLVELAKHQLLRESNPKNAWSLIVQAFKVNPSIALKSFPKVIRDSLTHHSNRRKKKYEKST